MRAKSDQQSAIWRYRILVQSTAYLESDSKIGWHCISPSRPVLSTIDIAGTELRKQKEELDKQQDALQSLDRVIDSITVGMSRKAFNSRLKALAKISFQNAPTFCEHILAEQIEQNIKPSTAESKIKLLIWLSNYHSHKPFEQMTKQDILSYLNSIRKPVSIDPYQR